MLNDAPILSVYEQLDNSVHLVGVLQDYTSIMYSPEFDDVGSFTLKLPYSKRAFDMLVASEGSEKILYIEDGIAGICHKIDCDFKSKSDTLTVKGTLAEGLLENAILGAYDYHVPDSQDEPYDIQDHIDYVLNHSSLLQGTLWDAVVFQPITTDTSFTPNNDVPAGKSTFGEFVRTLCKSCNKGYQVRLNLQTLKFDFSLSDYTNRGASSSSPVYISQDLVSLGDSRFTINSQGYKNRLMAWTEFDVDNQPMTAVLQIDYDEIDKQPHSKKEIRADYIKIDISSEEPVSSIAEGYARLKAKGKQALYESSYVKSYDCEVKEYKDNNVFRFNKDYFLGDIIAVKDTKLGMTVDAQLLEYTRTIDLKGSHFDPVFGVSQPTLNSVLKKQKIIR